MNISGTFLTLNTPTKNGNIYSTECMEKAITNIQKKIDTRRFLVERSATMSPDVSLGNVCGIVVSLKIDENKLVGDVELLDDLCGPEIKLGLSSGELFLRPKGFGTIIDGKVEDYALVSLCVTKYQS